MNRVWAVLLRHLYLYPRSFSRLMEIFYWPVIDLVFWGFLSLYLARNPSDIPNWSAFLLGAMILWDILFRAQQAVCISFLEEVWSRNLLNLFASPLSPGEFIAATMILSFIKFLLAAAVTAALAWALYGFNILMLGAALVPLTLNLVAMGWAIGIFTTAVILRFGERAEVLAWGIALLVQPFAAVFYPVSVYPPFLRPIALSMPATHAFEGMREVLFTGAFPASSLLAATGLNVLYLGAAFAFYHFMFHQARVQGRLTKLGE